MPRSEKLSSVIPYLDECAARCGTITALRVPLTIHKHAGSDVAIGTGYFNELPDGRQTSITAMDLEGVVMPEGNYYLRVSGVPMLVVLSKRVQ